MPAPRALTLALAALVGVSLACDDAPQPSPSKRALPSPSPAPAPASSTGMASVAAPVAAPAPTSAPGAESAETTAADVGDPIARLQARDVCQKLEARVARGSRLIAKGSLTRDCAKVEGAHPGHTLGGQDVWRPSSRPGAWVSVGACRLGG